MKNPIWNFKLNTWTFNYDVDNDYDAILQKCLSSGIIKAEIIDKYNIKIVFGNGVSLQGWNANHFYCWLNHGVISHKTCGTFSFRNMRPSTKTIFQLKEALISFRRDIFYKVGDGEKSEINKFNNCLK